MKTPIRQNGEIAPFLQQRVDAYLESSSMLEVTAGTIASMDREKIDALLPVVNFYNGVTKTEFIDQLQGLFSILQSSGDTGINMFFGKSGSDSKSKGYRFIGNRSGHFFELLIEVENNVLKGIRTCSDLTSPVRPKGIRLEAGDDLSPF
ncbi:MAG: hypothetical protein ACKOA1_02785 [Bacteroidota bacterium]